MRIECFAEFSKFELFEQVKASCGDVEIPSKGSIKATKTFGEEKIGRVQEQTFKLFYTPDEEQSGAVNKVVAAMEGLGVKVEDRHPYRENIIDAATKKTEKTYFKDRVILSI